ncbi:MAG: hypothetical protein ACI4E1_07700 [Lachnospira sp.]
MTVQEMTKIYKRICNRYEGDYCNECPLLSMNFGDGSADDCLNALIEFPDEFETALNAWQLDNPAPTNRDKFFEVFGHQAYNNWNCSGPGNDCTELPCYDCNWWDAEYIELKED